MVQPPPATPLTLEELHRLIRCADSAAVLLPARIVRRAIKQRHAIPVLRVSVPHHFGYVLSRSEFLETVDSTEIPPDEAASLPDRVILLAQPDQEELDDTPREVCLTQFWRMLFHQRLHLAVEEQWPDGPVGETAVRAWIDRLGPTTFDEARLVLSQQGYLFPECDDRAVLVEFVAVFFELRYFSPGSVGYFFPGVEDLDVLEEAFGELVDAERLLSATRPRGAQRPGDEPVPTHDDLLPPVPAAVEAREALVPARHRRVSEVRYRRLVERAQRAAAGGNVVRACIFLVRARNWATERAAVRLRSAVKDHLSGLVHRIQQVIGFSDDEADGWREALGTLSAHIAKGVWSVEARLLFDLQKICVDSERSVFAFNIVQWAASLGRRPIQRPLPRLREVLIFRHLRSAMRRLTAVRLDDYQRQRMYALLRQAEERHEDQLRSQLRPVMAAALAKAEFVPAVRVERAARDKIVEELIDRLLDRGYLTLGDLRDAVARNLLKARDVTRIRELLVGDQLLTTDREMARSLDGVYRRGEFYRRAMQTLSSLAFGTGVGRFLMRFLVLPFAGAFVAEAGVMHLYEFVTRVKVEVRQWPLVLALGVFMLLLMNVPAFRLDVWKGLKQFGRGLRIVFAQWPREFLALDLVQAILQSRYFRWTYRLLLKPAAVAALICWLVPRLMIQWRNTPAGFAMTFAAVSILLNSRLGRNLEELTTDWVARLWRWLGIHVWARLFWLIMDLSRASIEAVERTMYGVDEWLRFRSGEGRITLVVKGVLGSFWAVITYVLRFCINVLIEPQVNPIKHFPVVTVSHKVLLWFIPYLAGVLELAMEPVLAGTMATFIITSIPGIFGFLAWELRENWRLYEANRPKRLQPVPVGAHGETARRLLLPGFHSGTIPKRFARLRRADLEARQKGTWAGVRKHRRALREVELDVRRFIERELLDLLSQIPAWHGRPVRVGRVRLSTNRVRAEIWADAPAGLELVLEAQDTWLVASVFDRGFLNVLNGRQRLLLAAGLTGLCKKAGVDLVRQEVQTLLPGDVANWLVREHGLVVRFGSPVESEYLYAFGEGEPLTAVLQLGRSRTSLPVLDPAALLFGRRPIEWSDWMTLWEAADDPRRFVALAVAGRIPLWASDDVATLGPAEGSASTALAAGTSSQRTPASRAAGAS